MTVNVNLRTRAALRLAEKIPIYATGHDLEFTDDAAVRDIVCKAKTKDFGFRTHIREVVASTTFQFK